MADIIDDTLFTGWRRAFLLVVALVAGLGVAPATGAIIGHVDGMARDGEQIFLAGWACQQGQSRSISVRIFKDPRGANT